jgi:hypothetical protein
MRIRVMPVLGTSPSIFGQAMASYVLCSIAGKLYDPEICERISKNLKHKIRQVFKNNEVSGCLFAMCFKICQFIMCYTY